MKCVFVLGSFIQGERRLSRYEKTLYVQSSTETCISEDSEEDENMEPPLKKALPPKKLSDLSTKKKTHITDASCNLHVNSMY